MPPVQTSYTPFMRKALLGMKADMAPSLILSRFIETAGGIGFGLAVAQGTGDRQVRLGGTGPFVGATLLDLAAGATLLAPPTTPDQYQQNDLAAIMKKGSIWVQADGAVTTTGIVTYTQATGRFGAKAVAAGIVQIADAQFETAGADGDLVLLRLS